MPRTERRRPGINRAAGPIRIVPIADYIIVSTNGRKPFTVAVTAENKDVVIGEYLALGFAVSY